jgi:hypothetical protein
MKIGLIESNHPKARNTMKKYRLTEKGRDPSEVAPFLQPLENG